MKDENKNGEIKIEAKPEGIRWGYVIFTTIFTVWVILYATWLGYKAFSDLQSGYLLAFLWFAFWLIDIFLHNRNRKSYRLLVTSSLDFVATVLKDFVKKSEENRGLKRDIAGLRQGNKDLRANNKTLTAEVEALKAAKNPVKKLVIKKAPNVSKKAK